MLFLRDKKEHGDSELLKAFSALGTSVWFVPASIDIVIPGANSTTDVQARIGAGESIHVIKGSKGMVNIYTVSWAMHWITSAHIETRKH